MNNNKERKNVEKNRSFQEKWEHMFFMVENGSSKMCLRCQQSIKTLKQFNAKQHYKTCKYQQHLIKLDGDETIEAVNSLKNKHEKEKSLMT